MGEFVIAVYRPKEGKEPALADLVGRHVTVLRGEGLVTDRPAYAMRASDGSIVEVFEWLSKDAIDRAHTNPAVQKLWREFGETCEWGTLAQLPESQAMFPGFTPLEGM